MGIIKILDKHVIDKIAAGEVIERPVSIVKELIENSIDAGADCIEIEIKKGGKSYIGIRDNGKGIMTDDIGIIFERHATSKISCMEDLYESCSLGFRGEALSSIAAVSKVSLVSRHRDEELGNRVILSGGRELLKEQVAAVQGTSVAVEDLFFNTPVRLKFLKSDTTEAGQISDIIERLALCRADIAFHYINNGKTQLKTSGFNDLAEVMYHIYGKDVYENLLEINADLSIGKLTGYIGKPVISRGNRNRQSLFINNRYVKSFMLMKAVQEGYASFLMQHQFPLFVLKLSMDPSSMDVNVHPSKMEVNFENPSLIYKEVYHSVRKRLLELNTTDVIELRYDEEEVDIEPTKAVEKETSDNSEDSYMQQSLTDMDAAITAKLMSMGPKNNNEKAGCFDIGPFELRENTGSDLVKEEISRSYTGRSDKEKKEELVFDRGPVIKIIGQAFKTYIIAEIEDKLYLIDQHAAHEKINFERFLKSMNQEGYAQQLLKPVVLQLTAKEELTINKYLEVFSKLGFEIEYFGRQSYTIRAVPLSFYKMDMDSLFIELLDHLGSVSEIGNIELIKDKIAGVACKASIKGGQVISDLEAEHLIRELLKSDAPFNCPHGRPTMIAMSKYELEKKFKRIV